MTTIQLPNVSTFAFSTGFAGLKPSHFRKDNGTLVVQRVPVFRSGTFRDSMGDQFTYESLHINQMLENYNYLRNNSLFDDVPVRDGHPGFLINGAPGSGKVIGWHTSAAIDKLKGPHDGEEYDYLLVDFELTDPAAAASYENGTFRNRSAEVGRYRTNAEAEFWPVYMGVAFVDIPAVEGLKFSSSNSAALRGSGAKFFVMDDKEKSVGDNPQTSTVANAAAGAQGSGQHSAPAGSNLPFAVSAPHVFSVNGQQMQDYTAVQNHINVLEKFRADVQEGARKDFVTGLARENKIAATQLEATEKFAIGLTPDQFEAWKGTWTAAPAQPVLGMHGQTVTNPNNQGQQAPDPKAEQYKIWQDTVMQFKMAGMNAEAIKNTSSYKSLVAAGQTVNV